MRVRRVPKNTKTFHLLQCIRGFVQVPFCDTLEWDTHLLLANVTPPRLLATDYSVTSAIYRSHGKDRDPHLETLRIIASIRSNEAEI